MSKKIILLSDGTGNAASSPHKTNVWRLYKAFDLSLAKDDKIQQLAFYDDGVGTTGFLPTRLIGLAFGWGLKKNVKELYLNLCRVYEPEDEIYIFGFSRGAFTARVVAGLISSQGIVRNDGDEKKLRKRVDHAYINFRLDEFGLALVYFPFRTWYAWTRPLRSKKLEDNVIVNGNNKTVIKMIGVWDTVDAYGSPIDEMTRAWDRIVWPLSATDRNLSPKVGAAYHALALDEQRESFNPMLWNEETKEDANKGQILEQVWFSGVHANVGGGYPDDSLAHVSLDWMIGKCKNHSLRFNEVVVEQYRHMKNANGKIYNNRSGFGNLYRYAPRKVEEFCDDKKYTIHSIYRSLVPKSKNINNYVKIDCPKIHESVFERICNSGNAYAPIGLPEHYCTVDDDGNESLPVSSADQDPKVETNSINAETQEQAKQRRDQQGALWKKVWLGKNLYIVTLFAIIIYLLYPWSFTDAEVQQRSLLSTELNPRLGGIGDFIRLLPKAIGSIPGLSVVGDWAERYRHMPYEFVLGAIVIFSLLIIAKILHRHIREDMWKNWAHIAGGKINEARRNTSSILFTGLFDSRLLKRNGKTELSLSITDWAGYIFRLIAELFFILLLLLIIAVGIWRLMITIFDSNGQYCNAPVSSTANFSTPISFDPTEICFDTGLNLKKDMKYKLSFEISRKDYKDTDIATCEGNQNKHPWCDDTMKADALGWLGPTPKQFHLASFSKRHITKDWYEPIAKIGHKGLYRFSFEPSTKSSPSSNRPVWKTTIDINVARDGRLYVYLNDAIIPPIFGNFITRSNKCKPIDSSADKRTDKKSDMWIFYKNNCGMASITVEPLNVKPTDAKAPSTPPTAQ